MLLNFECARCQTNYDFEVGRLTFDEIMALCRKELAAFKCPKRVILVDALPRTPTGKILKREMRDSYRQLYSDG